MHSETKTKELQDSFKRDIANHVKKCMWWNDLGDDFTGLKCTSNLYGLTSGAGGSAMISMIQVLPLVYRQLHTPHSSLSKKVQA